MKIEYKFKIKGHENLLGTHETTLEFTKDKEVTRRGDCIVGADADFNYDKLKDFISVNKNRKIFVEIISGKAKDSFVCFLNKDFKSKEEIVIRKSEFLSDRTLGINASKSSSELDRKLIEAIKENGAEVTLKILKHKCIILDFDNTLEEFEHSKSAGEWAVTKEIVKRFGGDEKQIKKLMESIDYKFTIDAIEKKNPLLFDRIKWYHEYAKKNKLDIPESEVKKLVELYWSTITKNITEIAGATELLELLKEKYVLVMLTDSDGERKIKIDRVKKLKMEEYFDLIVTGDDTKTTKPDPKNYKYILEKLNKGRKEKIMFEECAMVGDKPPADHAAAKPLGITNIWFKYGHWKALITEKPAYIDFEADRLKEISKLMEKLDED